MGCNGNCNDCDPITSTQGPRGNTGATGPAGPKGDTGSSGTNGADYSGVVPVNNTSGGTLILTAADTGTTVSLNSTTGTSVTLPSHPPIGTNFDFINGVTVGSGSTTISAGTGVALSGSLISIKSAASPVVYTSSAGGPDNTITLNGSTTGGIAGGAFSTTYISTNKWVVVGNIIASGSQSTPFSTV